MIPCIVVPFLNRPDLLERMVSSIDFPVQHLVIINNSERKHSLHKLKVPEAVFMVDERVNHPSYGVASSWNYGLDIGFNKRNWDAVLTVGSDIQWSPGDLEKFYVAWKENPEADWLFGNWSFSTWMLTRKGFDAFGWFDENYERAYLEDGDAFRRIQLMESKMVSVDTHAIHGEAPTWGSSTIYSDPELKKEVEAAHGRNWEYHIRKWGGRREGNTERFRKPFNDISKPINWWEISPQLKQKPHFRSNS